MLNDSKNNHLTFVPICICNHKVKYTIIHSLKLQVFFDKWVENEEESHFPIFIRIILQKTMLIRDLGFHCKEKMLQSSVRFCYVSIQ